MTLFFAIVAVVHVCGLFAMLIALRRAPIAVENASGFQVIAEPQSQPEAAAARACTA
ncbi:MAG TPA: hypothetical protein PK322_03810 [Opitutaceae bacterium]|nr:hypothetical protein [Opitutaceae bacterium]